MTSQLWQLLIKIDALQPGETLTCADCFAIMELLLLTAELGADLNQLKGAAQDHLAHCPGCRERLQQQLQQLEEPGEQTHPSAKDR